MPREPEDAVSVSGGIGVQGYAPVMLGASRHDRQCESVDHGAGQPAAKAMKGLPNLRWRPTDPVPHIRAGVL